MAIKEYLDDLIGIIPDEIVEESDKLIIDSTCNEAATRCPSCLSYNIIRNGSKKKKIKDLPFDGKPVVLNLKHQRWLCYKCDGTFWSDISIVDETHYMTKRLFDFIISRAMDESTSKISEETNVSKRLIVNMINEFYDINRVDRIDKTLVFTKAKFKNKMRYFLINGSSLGLIDYFNDLDSAVKFVNNLINKNNKFILYIPANLEIQMKFSEFMDRGDLRIDYRSYARFINNSTFECYKKCRELVKKTIETKIKTENKYFFLPQYSMSLDELAVLMKIFQMNNLYHEFYSLRDELLDKNRRYYSPFAYSFSPITTSFSPSKAISITRLITSFLDDLNHVLNDFVSIEELPIHIYEDIDKMLDEIGEDISVVNKKMLLYKYSNYPNPLLNEMKSVKIKYYK